MRNLKHLVLMIVSFIFFSCGSSKSNKDTANSSPEGNPYESREILPVKVKGTLMSRSGRKIFYVFDNRVNTMEILLNHKTIKLSRERTASGIKYSNSHYTYTEWHGTSILTKNGIIIFESRKNQ